MNRGDDRRQEPDAPRDRLSRLAEATLRINESLDFDDVLQEVVDSARSLTGARYGVITTLDDSGLMEALLTSGVTPEEHRELWTMPDGDRLFEYLSRIPEPVRIRDLPTHIRSLGIPEFNPPVAVTSFLGTPIRHGGAQVGNFYLAEKEAAQEFTAEDEETLLMFAAQAALVIANARRYRDEQRARTHLETLIDTSPVGVAVFDARTGALTSVNREAMRIIQGLMLPDRPVEELLEVLIVRRADGREVSLAEFPLAQALSDSETVRVEEIVLSDPDGRSVTTLLNATPLRSRGDGEVDSVVVTMQDMTPLEDMERLRAEFLGMVSHELREPLTSIKGSADTLLESLSSLDPAETVQFLRIIKSQAERMRDLISELLDVARIETGTLPVSTEPVEVAKLVDEARNVFLSGGGRENVVMDLEPDLPPVLADGRRIVQVLGNLLSNAARYSHESSVIRVGARRDGGHVALSVADQGRGVASERLPHLFRKFSRIDAEGEREIAGSGLGLAICKGIVEAHGGRIWAESDGPGLGTRFTFTLPVGEEAGRGTASHTRRSRRAATPQARILAVDDDPQTLRYVRDTLVKAGYAPLVTADPDEALRLVETEQPNLVLMDLMLPGSDGIEVMRDIFQIARVPVIFLSAYGRDEIVARALEAGAADYMVKPFSATELTARIRAALRRRADPSLSPEPFALGALAIDYAERAVSVGGRSVELTATEYRLLFELSVNAGRVLTHDELLDRVWGMDGRGGMSAVRSAVKRLRGKLGDDAGSPKYVFAVPRVGYRMPKGEKPGQEET